LDQRFIVSGGDWAAVASAVVALVAAAIAIAQAKSAKEAADAAKRQATAAEDQVRLTGQQIQNSLKTQDEADGPMFKVSDATLRFSGERYATATLEHMGGAPCSKILAVASGDDVRYLATEVGGYEKLDHLEWANAAPGSKRQVIVMVEHELVGPVTVTLDLLCTARYGSRSWNRAVSFTVEMPEVDETDLPWRAGPNR